MGGARERQVSPDFKVPCYPLIGHHKINDSATVQGSAGWDCRGFDDPSNVVQPFLGRSQIGGSHVEISSEDPRTAMLCNQLPCRPKEFHVPPGKTLRMPEVERQDQHPSSEDPIQPCVGEPMCQTTVLRGSRCTGKPWKSPRAISGPDSNADTCAVLLQALHSLHATHLPTTFARSELEVHPSVSE